MNGPVAALFVRRDSIYKALPGVDCYDEDRDARTWPGGCQVVAHPPCRTWGFLKAFAKAPPHEHAFGPWAVGLARRWGGVVEHPLGSSLFRECGCPEVGREPDEFGGVLLRVDQFHWGHKARKRTLLYVVRASCIPPAPFREGSPTHVIDRPGKSRKTDRRSAGRLPCCGKRDRDASPPDFARWLVELARGCAPASV